MALILVLVLFTVCKYHNLILFIKQINVPNGQLMDNNIAFKRSGNNTVAPLFNERNNIAFVS